MFSDISRRYGLNGRMRRYRAIEILIRSVDEHSTARLFYPVFK